jgi:hypothetical protein
LLQVLESRTAPATFTVNNALDSGTGSLRQAILNSNSVMGADSIVFDSTFFATPRTISLTSGELLVTDDLTITGPGAGLLTVRRDPAAATNFRVFDLNFPAGGPGAVLSDMTITGGQDSFGGAISVGSPTAHTGATLRNAIVTGNSAGKGGGIYAPGGSTVSVLNSTISGNTATNGGGGVAAAGTLVIEDSTISGNSAAGQGGGVATYLGSTTIRNVTIAGNTAGTGGGGVFQGSSTLTIQNSTIVGNTATAPFGSGGIDGRATIDSTIVANNMAASGPDVLGTVTVNFSLILNPGGATITGSNNVFGADPRLGPLQNNGGSTQTMALLQGSPAIDAGSNPAGLTTDQRGIGFARVSGLQADIGAYEVQAPTAGGSFSNVTAAGGTSYTFTVTYADAVAVNVATLDSNDIRVTGPNGFNTLATFISVDVNTNGTPRTATYRFTPPGGSWTHSAGGTYIVSVEPGQVFNTVGAAVPAGAIGSFQVLIPQTFTVTNANDAGTGSLRDAITQANADQIPPDIVTFDPAFFATPRTISLQSALPVINFAGTISGPGAGLLTVRRDPGAAASFGIFDLPIRTFSLTISGITITGGAAPSNGGALRIPVADSVTLQDVVITGNSAAGQGGGVSLTAGSLTVRNSTISGNVAGTITGVPRRSGGGISVVNGTLLVENSTVAGNATPTYGGGIYLYNSSGIITETVRNCTISGNTAGINGGGISEAASPGSIALVVQNCTIANNTATSVGANAGGGGLATVPAASTMLVSTVVANNNNNLAPDVRGQVNASFSLIRNPLGAMVIDAGGNLPAGTDPLFAAAGLANNGGPTQTVALQATSPLIDKGSNPANLNTDQRGAGFARVFGPAADIGAFEVQPGPAQVSSVVVNAGQPNLVQRSMVTSMTVTFSRLVTFGGSAINAFQLTRTGPSTPNGSVTLAVDLTGSTATQTVARLTFSGALTEGANSLIDGDYTLTVASAQLQGGLQSGDSVTSLFRLFGDVNGDKAVDGFDLTMFRNALGSVQGNASYLAYLDFNGDGAIDGADLTQFRNRFGVILP